MPARAVQQEGGVDALGQGGAEAVEEGLHGGRAHLGQHESEGLIGAGADRAEDPG